MTRSILGVSLALTGPEAPYARQLLHAVELAIADAGRGQVALHVEDDASEASAAAQAAHRLVATKALAVVGPMNSWTCEVQAPIFAAAGLCHVTPSASNPLLSRHGWPTFFRACANDDHQADVLAAAAFHLLGARRVAAIHDATSFAEPLAESFARAGLDLGMTVTAVAACADHDADGPRRVATSAPDAILVAGLEAACAGAARALREHGARAVFLGTDAVKPTHVLRMPGYPAPLLTNSATDATRQAPELHARFVRAGVPHDSVYTVEAFDVMRRLAAWAASHPEATRADAQACLRTPFDGLAGCYAFGQEGERPDARIGIYRDEPDGLRYLGSAREVLRT